MKKNTTVIIFLIIVGILGVVGYFRYVKAQKVHDFETCIAYPGAIVLESYPGQCIMPDKRVFMQTIPTVTPDEETVPTVSEDADSPNIIVISPKSGATIRGSLIVNGRARVFENVLQYRLSERSGKVLATGNITADSPDVGKFGDFSVTINYASSKETRGVLDVFSYSAKDGSEINKVSIPLTFDSTQY